MKAEERENLITVTVAQTILDCATHTQNNSQMVQAVARDAGLYPLKPKDAAVLRKGLGPERYSRFIKLCERS